MPNVDHEERIEELERKVKAMIEKIDELIDIMNEDENEEDLGDDDEVEME